MSISRGKALVQMALNQNVIKDIVLENPVDLSIDQCTNGENKENTIIVFESEECIPKISLNLAQVTPLQNIVIEESNVAVSASSEALINFNTKDYFNKEPNKNIIILNAEAENLSTDSSHVSDFEPATPGSSQLESSQGNRSDNDDTGEDLAEDQNERINTSDRGSNESALSNTDQFENQDVEPYRKRKISREQRFQNKRLRMLGQGYKGLKKNPSGGNYKLCDITARKMGPNCSSRVCKNSKVVFCSSFSENDRKLLFESFLENFNMGHEAHLHKFFSRLRSKQTYERKFKTEEYINILLDERHSEA